MKRVLRIPSLLIFGLIFCSLSAQARIPSNCAVDSEKLSELARSAHQLPPGFDRNIFGNWQHATRIQGHDVSLRVGKYKNGQFKIRLKVSGWFKNFDEEQPMMICTTNKRSFEVYSHLNGKDQQVDVEVLSVNQIQLLEGQLSGKYNRR